MGRALHLIRDAFVQAIGGYSASQVRDLVVRANKLADLAMKGKYPMLPALQVAANRRVLRRLSNELLQESRYSLERKRGVRVVEGRDRGGTDPVASGTGEVIDEARPERLLAANPGFNRGAFVHQQRECVSSVAPSEELQGEVEVLDMVPPDCA